MLNFNSEIFDFVIVRDRVSFLGALIMVTQKTREEKKKINSIHLKNENWDPNITKNETDKQKQQKN